MYNSDGLPQKEVSTFGILWLVMYTSYRRKGWKTENMQ